MNPYVKFVQPQEDYCLLVIFENGEKRIFDLKPYLEKPIFQRLKNMAVFQTARVVSGSIEWQGEVDLSYDTLYLESKAPKDAQSRPKTTRSQTKNLTITAIPKKKSSKSRATVK
jgi:uncharacterized protein DUF2442